MKGELSKSVILPDYNISEFIKAIEDNFFSLSMFLGIRERYDGEYLKWAYSGGRALNRVFNIHLTEESVSNKIQQVLSVFKMRNVPVMWITGPSTEPQGIKRYLEDRGITYKSSWTGMAVDLNEIQPKNDAASSLTFKEVDSQGMLKIWSDVVIKSFSMPDSSSPDFYKVFADIGTGDDKPWSHYLAYKDGIPSASCTLYKNNSTAGIYWVGTIPEARGQGISSSILNYVLLIAKDEGYKTVVLQATDAGKGLYGKLGFKEYCKLDIYMWSI